jgi:hypothetical protein
VSRGTEFRFRVDRPYSEEAHLANVAAALVDADTAGPSSLEGGRLEVGAVLARCAAAS